MALPNTSVVAVGIEPPLLTGHALEPLTLPIEAPRDALEDLARGSRSAGTATHATRRRRSSGCGR